MGQRKTIYADQNGDSWVYERRLPAEWAGEKKAAFRALVDGVLDSEETEAVRDGDEWIVSDWGSELRLTRTKETFLDEGW